MLEELKKVEGQLRLELRDCQANQQRVEAGVIQRLINVCGRMIEAATPAAESEEG